MEKQHRGGLTDRVKQRAKKLLGYDISVTELRLMPYIQFVAMNDKKIDPQKINWEELSFLTEWINKSYILFNDDHCLTYVDKKFWNAMSELLYLAYVDLTD